MPTAIVRPVSPAIQQCELTHLERQPIDFSRAQSQHTSYCTTLAANGYQVVELSVAEDLADSVFVEDTALVLPELAIITRPGAASRRPELAAMAAVLQNYRQLAWLSEPSTLDGGDVVVLGKTIWIGLSSRSNQAAVEQVQALTATFGYRVQGVELGQCLHLKTAVCAVDSNTVLLNPQWVEPQVFAEYQVIEVDPREEFAANVVQLHDGRLLYDQAYSATAERLRQRGYQLILVDNSELTKAEGALTCCSVLIQETEG